MDGHALAERRRRRTSNKPNDDRKSESPIIDEKPDQFRTHLLGPPQYPPTIVNLNEVLAAAWSHPARGFLRLQGGALSGVGSFLAMQGDRLPHAGSPYGANACRRAVEACRVRVVRRSAELRDRGADHDDQQSRSPLERDPCRRGLHASLRTAPTARTMVSASINSTSDAKNAARSVRTVSAHCNTIPCLICWLRQRRARE